MVPMIGTMGVVKFSTGETAGVVAGYIMGERNLLVTLFVNTAAEAEGITGTVASYPTKVGDKVSDFQPFEN